MAVWPPASTFFSFFFLTNVERRWNLSIILLKTLISPSSSSLHWTYSSPLLRGPITPLPGLLQASEGEENCSVLLCLFVKLGNGHCYYYYYCYYDYKDELSCCCCYTKTGPSAIDLKPQQSRALASRSAPREPDRPPATLTATPSQQSKNHTKTLGGLCENPPTGIRSSSCVSQTGWFLCFCFLGLDLSCFVTF